MSEEGTNSPGQAEGVADAQAFLSQLANDPESLKKLSFAAARAVTQELSIFRNIEKDLSIQAVQDSRDASLIQVKFIPRTPAGAAILDWIDHGRNGCEHWKNLHQVWTDKFGGVWRCMTCGWTTTGKFE